MAYDEHLAARARALLQRQPGYSERTMFGGIAFMLHGHMACGIVKDELMVRVGPAAHDAAVRLPHAREMDFAGRPMRGMLFVAAPALASEGGLHAWLQRAVSFTRTLPPKADRSRPAKAARKAKPKARVAGKRQAAPARKAALRAKAGPKTKPKARARTTPRRKAARRTAGARGR